MNKRVYYRNSLIYLTASVLWFVIIGAALWSPLGLNWLWSSSSITLFVPPLVIDQKIIKQFEKETGISVAIAYYENATALLNKMNSTKGHGYDIIFSDDHSLESLTKSGLLHSLEKKELPFFTSIDPIFYQNYYDPALQYTIPYFSLVYGIAYNAAVFDKLALQAPISWSFMFHPPAVLHHRLGMTDEPREALLLATYLTYRDLEAIREPRVQQEMVAVLREQKQYVDVYSLERADHLIQTENCLAAVMVSGDYWRVKRKSPHIAFTVPQEGAFVGFYSFAVLDRSNKKELAYQLIRYLFKPEVMRAQGSKFGFMPSIASVMAGASMPPSIYDYKDRPVLFFRNVIPDSAFNDLWIQVLS